jgi:hypothetical protein
MNLKNRKSVLKTAPDEKFATEEVATKVILQRKFLITKEAYTVDRFGQERLTAT